MADNKQTENFSKKQKTISTPKTIAISVFILITALGIGIVIKESRKVPTEKDPEVQSQVVTDANITNEPEVIYTIPQNIDIPEPAEEVVVEPKPEPDPVPQPVSEEPVQNEQVNARDIQRRQDAMQWMSWFGSLSQEDQMQLFRGSIMSYLSLMQRWQNLPAEQVQQEQALLRGLIEGWQNLPAEDRQQGIQNIQYQIEQWLQYGQQY